MLRMKDHHLCGVGSGLCMYKSITCYKVGAVEHVWLPTWTWDVLWWLPQWCEQTGFLKEVFHNISSSPSPVPLCHDTAAVNNSSCGFQEPNELFSERWPLFRPKQSCAIISDTAKIWRAVAQESVISVLQGSCVLFFCFFPSFIAQGCAGIETDMCGCSISDLMFPIFHRFVWVDKLLHNTFPSSYFILGLCICSFVYIFFKYKNWWSSLHFWRKCIIFTDYNIFILGLLYSTVACQLILCFPPGSKEKSLKRE